ncbi:hypothetical protein HHI36_007293 [Cryptolaemus montrouzieri]|uniref:Pyridoxal phosphate homeostasis protein n=1 Tax=Cryptolaemus montrouzieri TaxID=559131 RepID=A0ABD2MPX9_9CUCU
MLLVNRDLSIYYNLQLYQGEGGELGTIQLLFSFSVMLKTMSEVNVKLGLKSVLSKIQQACAKREKECCEVNPRLVAVSKTKPVESIIEAYEEGQRHFGENYVQELEEKANNSLILESCKDIKWHFIGHLQGNKVNKVISIPNLYIVETVDSKKLANKLNNNWPQFGGVAKKLRVFIQINTSGEKEKNGILPSEVVDMVKYVTNDCPNLQLDGIMTIGQYGYNPADGPNPDFLKLLECRKNVCEALSLPLKDVEISMGMSDDFEQAVEMGSTNVRVGTAIFGYRPKKTSS